MLRSPLLRTLLPVALLVSLPGCAAKQKIALDCIPDSGAIFVDGQRLDEVPSELVLRSDRPHTVYYKGAGAVPELVVLKSEEVDGDTRLAPAEICIRPRRLRAGQELTVEIDRSVSAAPPSGDSGSVSTVDLDPRPDFILEAP
ncbi:MAG: hypothetical protein ACE5FL_14655 [Myxococcota bacterium]